MTLTLHALLVACQEGDVVRVTHILDSGEVGINAPDESEITALQVTKFSSCALQSEATMWLVGTKDLTDQLKQGPTRHRPMAHPVVFRYLSYSTTFAEHAVHRLRDMFVLVCSMKGQ